MIELRWKKITNDYRKTTGNQTRLLDGVSGSEYFAVIQYREKERSHDTPGWRWTEWTDVEIEE